MKDYFHGVDVVSIDEFASVLETEDQSMSPRIFSDCELQRYQGDKNRLQHLAGRFAAKEAILKALGTGFGTGISFNEIVILRNKGEPPYVELRGNALVAANEIGVDHWVLSISYGAGIAIASVIGTSKTV